MTIESELTKRLQRIGEEIRTQTDRGAAIIGAAVVEESLTEAIRAQFAPGHQPQDDLLSGSGPAATFSAKSDLAFALGLIGPKTYRDLTLVRKIRNRFAHELEALSFEDQTVANRCTELHWPSTLQWYDGGSKTPAGPRMQYLIAITEIMRRLWAMAEHPDYPDRWRCEEYHLP